MYGTKVQMEGIDVSVNGVMNRKVDGWVDGWMDG